MDFPISYLIGLSQSLIVAILFFIAQRIYHVVKLAGRSVGMMRQLMIAIDTMNRRLDAFHTDLERIAHVANHVPVPGTRANVGD